MTPRSAKVALLGCGLMLAAGCARPDQLGAPAEATEPAVPPAAPAAPAGPVDELLGSGRVDSRVVIGTRGPAQVIVRREVIEPGTDTGWLRNPGFEIVTVSSGGVALQLATEDEGTCEESTYGAGQAYFVPDATPYRVRNDGSAPAELIVTRMFAPNLPDPENVAAPCETVGN